MKTEEPKRTMKAAYAAILLALLAIAAIPFADALGVGPSRQQISFSPGAEIEAELYIINDKNEDFRAAVYAQGDLSNYITIEQPLVEVSAKDYMTPVKYRLKMPNTPPTPGPHKIELVVRQFPKGSDAEEGTMITANLALISQIILKVPYPGKYAEGKLFISGTQDPTNPATFVVMLYNFGSEEITDAHARFEIQGPLLGKIAEFNTQSAGIKSKEEAKLEAQWQPSVNKGTYKAVVTVYYDDRQMTLSQNFDIGNFVIDISDIRVEKFTLGDVAKFDIYLANNWNTQMAGVYVEMTVEDSTGKKMTEFKTAAIDIEPSQAGKLEAYWYTQNVMPGTYKVKLLVHYAEKVAQKEYDFVVDTNSITRIGAVGKAVVTEAEKKEITTQGLLIVLIMVVIVLLLIMNLVWFYFLARKIKGKGEDK
jgi:hypothetical protein